MSVLSAPTSDSTDVSLWIWLAGTALLTAPAIGNFFQIGLYAPRAHAIVTGGTAELLQD